jgi:hypothetical protein
LCDAKEVGLMVNIKKTNYKFMSHHQNAGQNHNINTIDKILANVAEFKTLGTTVTKLRLQLL